MTAPQKPRHQTLPKPTSSGNRNDPYKSVGSETNVTMYQGLTLPESEPAPQDTQDADLVKRTLREIMQDAAAPAAARAQAARTMAEMVQALGRHAAQAPADSKPIRETTRGDLEAELARLLLG